MGFTEIVATPELATAQTPLCTTALYCVVCVNIPEVYVVEVFTISVQTLNGDTELCHFITVPV